MTIGRKEYSGNRKVIPGKTMTEILSAAWLRFEKWASSPKLNLWKTCYVNLRTLPIGTALRLPVWVYGSVRIAGLRGKIRINGRIRTGMVRLGQNTDLLSAPHPALIYMEKNTCIIFGSKCRIGSGYILRLTYNATIEFGDRLNASTNVTFACSNYIRIGTSTDIAHGSRIMDTDFHYTSDAETGQVSPKSIPISIGERNWIASNCTVMKGTVTRPDTITATGSLLNKDYTSLPGEYPLFAGSPARVVKTGRKYIRSAETELQIDHFFEKNPNTHWYEKEYENDV